MMDRRAALSVLVAGALAAPLGAAGAQPAGTPPKIGVLSPQSRGTSAAGWAAFREGLHDLGWEEGRNIVIEARFADGKLDRLHDLAEELLTLNVSLIVSQNSPGTHAAIAATKTVPIVMVEVGDPVATAS